MRRTAQFAASIVLLAGLCAVMGEDTTDLMVESVRVVQDSDSDTWDTMTAHREETLAARGAQESLQEAEGQQAAAEEEEEDLTGELDTPTASMLGEGGAQDDTLSTESEADCGRMCAAGDRDQCCAVALQPVKMGLKEWQATAAAQGAFLQFQGGYSVATATDSDFQTLQKLSAAAKAAKAQWTSSPSQAQFASRLTKCAALRDQKGCVAGGAAGVAALRAKRNVARVDALSAMIKRLVLRGVRIQMVDILVSSATKRQQVAAAYLATCEGNKALAVEAAASAAAALKAQPNAAKQSTLMAADRRRDELVDIFKSAAADAALQQAELDNSLAAKRAQLKAISLQAAAEQRITELDQRINDATTAAAKGKFEAARDKQLAMVRAAWNAVPDPMNEKLTGSLAGAAMARQAAQTAFKEASQARRLLAQVKLRQSAQPTKAARAAMQPAVYTADQRVKAATRLGQAELEKARFAAEGVSKRKQRQLLLAHAATTQGVVLREVAPQLASLRALALKVNAGPLTALVKRELREARAHDRALALQAAKLGGSQVAIIVLAGEQARAVIRQQLAARTTSSEGVQRAKAHADYDVEQLLKEFGRIDEQGYDTRRHAEATVVAEASMKAVKSSMETMSVLSRIVEKAVVASKRGKTVRYTGGAGNAAKWWGMLDGNPSPAGCDSWTHLEIARTAQALSY